VRCDPFVPSFSTPFDFRKLNVEVVLDRDSRLYFDVGRERHWQVNLAAPDELTPFPFADERRREIMIRAA
jgi:hypothetical protein